MSASKTTWKDYLLNNLDLDISNCHLEKIEDLSGDNTDVVDAFKKKSKKPGIAFISLDPTESSIQLFHHGHMIGGRWSSPNKTLASILGVDDSARPIQIILKSIRMAKTKAISLSELIGDNESMKKLDDLKQIIGDDESMKNLDDLKQTKSEFHFMNILPNPNLLTKAYLSLKYFDPQSVAQAF
jgi:hypothetical protein